MARRSRNRANVAAIGALPEKVALVSILIWICGCTSFSGSPPHVDVHPLFPPPSQSVVAWSVTNLSPSDSTILVDGTRQDVSVDVSVADLRLDGARYDVALETTSEQLQPFELRTTSSGLGELDFSGTLTWSVGISGKSETLTVALLRTGASQPGRAAQTTSLRRISRTYRVTCNRREWVVKRTLKQLFGRCVNQQ